MSLKRRTPPVVLPDISEKASQPAILKKDLPDELYPGAPIAGAGSEAPSPSKPRLSRFAEYAPFAAALKLNNLGWHEVPLAVEHPRDTEKPPGTPSGRRPRLEIAPSPVERLFPPSGGVSRGSVRVGGETFLLPSYGFSFGYKRKGVSFAPPTEARRKIVGQ